MAQTRTGLDNWLGEMGTDYAHELTRQAARVASELGEEATSGVPRVVTILRREHAPGVGNQALGIPPVWSSVNGLENLPATVFHPNKWDTTLTKGDIRLLEGKRTILVADVPAGGAVGADRIIPTDVIRYDDPLYGLSQFEVLSSTPVPGPGLVLVEAQYVRRDAENAA